MLSDLDKNKIIILIPSLNPEKELLSYIDELINNGYKNIIIVNDGSNSNYDNIFKEIVKKDECVLLKHDINKGKGRALKTGFEYILENEKYADCIGVITADSDGQHLVKDIEKIAYKMNEESLILGTRDFTDKNIPKKSSFGNKVTSKVLQIFYGAKISDTQTGLRGIPIDLLNPFINVDGNRFEYETNMLIKCILDRIKIEEVSITTVYIDNNSGTNFKPIRDSISIYWQILKYFIRYSAVSIMSCLIDMLIFGLIISNLPLNIETSIRIWISTIIARIISSLVNYSLNKKITFNSKKNIKNTIIKYYILCIAQMVLSASLVSIIYDFIKIPEIIIKAIVDTIIFFINYRIQRIFIFNK